MQIDILKDVAALIAGERARGVVDLLFGKKNVNEFLISKKLKLTINQTRNMLYKLSDEGVVGFIRKKDNKKGGWYTYFWTFNIDRGLVKAKEKLIHDLGHLRTQMNSKRTERFYHCPNCSLEFNEESALIQDYYCLECGGVLQSKDNVKEVQVLEKEIKKNESLLVKVEEEIKIIEEKHSKSTLRRIKVQEKKKKSERDIKRKKKQAALKRAKNKVVNAPKKIKSKSIFRSKKR